MGLTRPGVLFAVLTATLATCAVTAEFVGVKIFSLERSLGYGDFTWRLLGQSGNLQFSAGTLLWPVVFVVTDVINDYFGTRGVRAATYLTAGLIAFAFAAVGVAIWLEPAPWWRTALGADGPADMQESFAAIFGQGMWIIVGSLVAFFVGQLLDALVFRQIKRRTGDRLIWLRATASTLVGQFIDSFIVLYIAFVLGPQRWGLDLFFAVGSVNFAYKLIVAILMIPALYGIHALIARYLGHAFAAALRAAAVRG